jgi:hypothetical protein
MSYAGVERSEMSYIVGLFIRTPTLDNIWAKRRLLGWCAHAALYR